MSAFQRFWRCAHHPSAIENFYDGRTTCEWDCHTTTLQPHHGGFHQLPQNWGTQNCGGKEWADLQRSGL